jgi:hypothetical protein
VNDLDRWVNLEGPEPDDIRELLDAACDERTPEEEARMERNLFAAIAEDRRRWAQRRTRTRVLGGALLAACLGGALAVALRLPNAARAVPSRLVGTESVEVPASGTARPR